MFPGWGGCDVTPEREGVDKLETKGREEFANVSKGF